MAPSAAATAAATSQPQSSASTPRPIIVVTGANAGLGFATCQRLLLQLSSPTPSDTWPLSPSLYPPGQEPLATPFAAPRGCTLIMACRNPIKAHKARRALVDLVERMKHLPDDVETPTSASKVQKHSLGPPVSAKSTLLHQEPDEVIAQGQQEETVLLNSDAQDGHPPSRSSLRRRRSGKGGGDAPEQDEDEDVPVLQDDISVRNAKARGKYRRRFCRGTKIEFLALDLGSMASVLTCAQQIQERYPYLTHLIHNAGGAAFTGINFWLASWMMLTRFHAAVTFPKFKMQRSGDVSQDGLGWVWQINVGSSWALTQALLPHMRKSPYSTPSRVIFTSSVEALQKYYIPDDFQCFSKDDEVSKPYESTKFQCDLAAHALSRRLTEQRKHDAKTPEVVLTHPGVVATSIMAEFLNVFTTFATLVTFYLARWTFSTHHVIDPYKGAIAHCYASLAPSHSLVPYARYGSRSDFWGRESVNNGRTNGWDAADEEAQEGHISRLAADWAEKADAVVKRIRRDSDAGVLPPSKQLREELRSAVVEQEEESAETKEDWEKVERTV